MSNFAVRRPLRIPDAAVVRTRYGGSPQSVTEIVAITRITSVSVNRYSDGDGENVSISYRDKDGAGLAISGSIDDVLLIYYADEPDSGFEVVG